jgi:putative sigma-54 modulation protein
MNIVSLKGTHLELTDAIQTYVTTKVQSVQKFVDDYGAAAELAIECGRTSNHHNKGDVFQCHMTLQIPGTVLRAERTGPDLYEAIDLVKDELIRQIKDYKGRVADRERGVRPDKA